MAQAAFAGADGVSGRAAVLLPACAASAADLLAASAYLFVFPENLGSMTGAMKEFFDRTYYPLLRQIEGRAYASAIAAGSDGTGAQRQLDRIVTGWRLRRVAEPLICISGAQSPEAILSEKQISSDDARQCHDLGKALVNGIAMGIF